MELLFHELGINGYTLLAQIANFLILLFLLKKFLYKPLLSHLDKRKEIIEEGLMNAEKAKDELQKINKIKEEKIIEAEREADKIIEKSKKTAEEKGNVLLREATNKSDSIIKEAKKRTEEERREAVARLTKEIGILAVSAAELILKREIDRQENEKIIKEKLNQLLLN